MKYIPCTYSKIVESLDRCDLKSWNNVQKNIWLKLVSDRIVKYDDMHMFFEMGQIFSDYFEKNREAPSYKLLVSLLTH